MSASQHTEVPLEFWPLELLPDGGSPLRAISPPSAWSAITMDLIGPMGARETGHVRHAVPLYILVITDPFSHMLWLQPITTKAPEEVYKKLRLSRPPARDSGDESWD